MNDSGMMPESEASRTRPSEHVSEGEAGERSGVACSSNTQLNTRQLVGKQKESDGRLSFDGTTGIDWWQLSAAVSWNPADSTPWFGIFQELKERAQATNRPVPLEIGDDLVCVDHKGHGKGRDAHKEIQLLWNGAVVGLSQRNNASRQMSNASLIVSGEPCLVTGWGTCWDFFHRVVAAIGGKILDEWIRRLDLCLDFPEVCLDECLGTALRNGYYVGTVSKCSLHLNPDGVQGFSLGKSSLARVVIYDKLRDVMENHDSVYKNAMIQRRWFDELPSAATRVEFQIGRAWLKAYGINTSTGIGRIGDIYEKLTSDERATFRITATAVDRENRHQNRAKTHPVWERMLTIGRETVGECLEKLKRIERKSMDEKRALKQIIGYATSIADRRRVPCNSRDELFAVFGEACDENRIGDDYIKQKFNEKAKLSGTYQHLYEFPPKEAA